MVYGLLNMRNRFTHQAELKRALPQGGRRKAGL